MDKNKKTVTCAVCGREFDPWEEISVEMDATAKDGSHYKCTLCMECFMKFLEG